MKNKKIKKYFDNKFDILAKALLQASPEKLKILKPVSKLIGECKDCEFAKRTENTVSECNRANLGCNDENNSAFEPFKKIKTIGDLIGLHIVVFNDFHSFVSNKSKFEVIFNCEHIISIFEPELKEFQQTNQFYRIVENETLESFCVNYTKAKENQVQVEEKFQTFADWKNKFPKSYELFIFDRFTLLNDYSDRYIWNYLSNILDFFNKNTKYRITLGIEFYTDKNVVRVYISKTEWLFSGKECLTGEQAFLSGLQQLLTIYEQTL